MQTTIYIIYVNRRYIDIIQFRFSPKYFPVEDFSNAKIVFL